LIETLAEHAPPYATVKNWVAQFKSGDFSTCILTRPERPKTVTTTYEGRLISNAHSEISRKRDNIFKQMKMDSKVQYFSYKLTYLFFDIVALSFNTFFPT
jgi:hypothetical protein